MMKYLQSAILALLPLREYILLLARKCPKIAKNTTRQKKQVDYDKTQSTLELRPDIRVNVPNRLVKRKFT